MDVGTIGNLLTIKLRDIPAPSFNNKENQMILKKGVRTLGIRTEILLAIFIADGVYKENGQELVVTSITDGKHKRISRHYLGVAADLRTRYFTKKVVLKVARKLRAKLGKDYLVLVERTHIHLSWKPQR